MQSATVTTSDNVDLRVYESDGGSRSIVLIPGFTAAASSWVFQSEALLGAGYHVVVVDRRSHGKSAAPSYGQRMARHGMDLHEVIQDLALDRPVLFGASMGASTIWAYLDLITDRHIAGVVSVDQTPRMRAAPDWPYGFYGLTDDNSGVFFARGVPDTGHGPSPERSSVGMTAWVARTGGLQPGEGQIRPETLPLLRDHAQQDWRDVVSRTSVPVLAVAGRQSQFWPAEHAAALADLASSSAHSSHVVIEDCGHTVGIDQPELLNRHLLEFVAALPP